MPINIPGNPDNYPENVKAPSASDAGIAAGIQVLADGLANRTAYLRKLVEQGGAGITRIRTVESTAAMSLLTDMNDGDVVLVPGFGLYSFIAGDVVPGSGYMYVAGVGGMWLHVIGVLRGLSLGFAALDSDGKVVQEPASKAQPGGVASLDAQERVSQEVKRIQYVNSPSEVSAPPATGDIIQIGFHGLYRYNASSTATPDGAMVADAAPHPGRWLWLGASLRGWPNGLASLNSSSRVPNDQLGRGVAGGVAELDGGGKVPDARLGGALVKAWGRVTTGSGGPTAHAASGLSFSYEGSSLLVTISPAMPSNDYCVLLTQHGTHSPRWLLAQLVNSGSFRIYSFETTGPSEDLTINYRDISIAVLGG